MEVISGRGERSSTIGKRSEFRSIFDDFSRFFSGFFSGEISTFFWSDFRVFFRCHFGPQGVNHQNWGLKKWGFPEFLRQIYLPGFCVFSDFSSIFRRFSFDFRRVQITVFWGYMGERDVGEVEKTTPETLDFRHVKIVVFVRRNRSVDLM